MTQIRYIGCKPMKEDNVARTGTVWHGHGDVREVKDPAAVSKLLSFSTVWEEVGATDEPGNAEGEPISTATQKVVELDALRDKAKSLGIDVKGTWGVQRLTKAITDAEAGKSA